MIDSKRGVLRTGEAHSGIAHGVKYSHAKTQAGALVLASLGRAPGKPESALDFVCAFYSDNFVNLFSFTHLWHFKFNV